jgi:hypothetical protein
MCRGTYSTNTSPISPTPTAHASRRLSTAAWLPRSGTHVLCGREVDRIDAGRPGGAARRYIQDGAAHTDAGPAADRPASRAPRASETAAEGVPPPAVPVLAGAPGRGADSNATGGSPARSPISPPGRRAARAHPAVPAVAAHACGWGCYLPTTRSSLSPGSQAARPLLARRTAWPGVGRARRPACRAGAGRQMGSHAGARVSRSWACVPRSPGADAGCPEAVSRARRLLLLRSSRVGRWLAHQSMGWLSCRRLTAFMFAPAVPTISGFVHDGVG